MYNLIHNAIFPGRDVYIKIIRIYFFLFIKVSCSPKSVYYLIHVSRLFCEDKMYPYVKIFTLGTDNVHVALDFFSKVSFTKQIKRDKIV